ncbi:alpha,alpha-trehalase [Ancylostoma caninum]|uniref:Trehalase n=1 Tax=Ancylostoma caninum TaxID=29170 RepID=A0A368FCD7_ANCCA|nr:alpha,alpha-trehalase [Ancylostoma caninum]
MIYSLFLYSFLSFSLCSGSLLDQVHWIEEPVPVCDRTNSNNSHIYCNSTLLMAVNYHELYNDSKTFVDMPMKNDPDFVLEKFNEAFGNISVEAINRTKLQQFVDEHFRKRDLDRSSNRKQQLSLLVDLSAAHFHHARRKIQGVLLLGRLLDYQGPTRMFGFVPNGGRVYYLRRSQPPLLAGMVYEYYEVTKDKDFVMKMLPILEKELTFWNNNRMTTVTVKGTDYFVYRYNTKSNMPRPESYAQDIKKAQSVPDKAQFWQDIASAAESGWDFSTRWFSDHKTIYTVETKNVSVCFGKILSQGIENKRGIIMFREIELCVDLRCAMVLPVDLNAFICWNFDILEYLYERIGKAFLRFQMTT